MKYLVTMIILLLFTAPMAFATGGGPSFEQLYKNSHKDKRVVELIDQSSKEKAKLQVCLRNIAQNKVEKKAC